MFRVPLAPTLMVILLAGITSGAPGSANAGSLAEDELKAAFLYKFAHFVTWPTSRDQEMAFCLTGRRSFEDALNATLDKIKASPFESEVRRIKPGRQCQTLCLVFNRIKQRPARRRTEDAVFFETKTRP